MRKYWVNIKNGLMASWFGISNPWGSDSFTTVSGSVSKATIAINSAMSFSALVAVIIIVWGGYLMITAAGDAEKIEQGNKMIVNGVIGMAIVFLAGVGVKYLVTEVLGM